MPRTLWTSWGFICCALAASGCQRASLSSFVPTLHVRLEAQRSRSHILDDARFVASVTGWLRFQRRPSWDEAPLRAEMYAETSALPCELDDAACLEEFSESEARSTMLLEGLE